MDSRLTWLTFICSFMFKGGEGGRPEAMVGGKTVVSLFRKKGASGMSRGFI